MVQNGHESNGHHAITAHDDDDASKLIHGIFQLVEKKLSPSALKKTDRIHNFYHPETLMQKFDFALHKKSNEDWQSILQKCNDIVDLSIKAGHRFYLQQLSRGADPYGFAAAVLIEALNTSMYTYDVAPVTTLIENEVIAQLVKLCGWSEGDGIFCPGGSMANMYGINLARFYRFRKAKTLGMMEVFGQKRPIIFASEQCHYSTNKGAAFMGFGTNSVVSVKSRADGSMDPRDLVKKIEFHQKKNDQPLMVVNTCGTTVLNAYDPLNEVADICEKYGLWLHADICFGGAALLTENRRYLLKGIERADSAAWSWHKVLNAPFQTCVSLCRHKSLLKECHSDGASYLFAPDKHYDTSYDTGDATIQCGRKADALKVWLMWKARGSEQLGALVDEAFQAAEYFGKMIENNKRFRMVIGKSQGTSVCFWILPPSLAGRKDQDSVAYHRRLHEISSEIKGRLVTRGLGMIACQPLKCWQLPNFFRVTFGSHPLTTKKDVDDFIEILVNLSDDL
jgi:glutamate/tyrosine decarboxylase-like PLP-dependent enzyme